MTTTNPVVVAERMPEPQKAAIRHNTVITLQLILDALNQQPNFGGM